jgi:hypothetical protein
LGDELWIRHIKPAQRLNILKDMAKKKTTSDFTGVELAKTVFSIMKI